MNKYFLQNLRNFLKPYKNVNVYMPQLKVIYISISKTGISSIRSMFLEKIGEEYDKENYGTIHHKTKEVFNYIPQKEIDKNHDCFKFSMVRNPFDRLVSCYTNKILKEDYPPIQKGYGNLFYQGMPFDEFVHSVCKVPDIFSDRHFRSQYSYIYYKGKSLVDYIGRFENLEEDLAFIIDKYDLGKIPHINKSSKRSDYRDYYTPELVELAYQRYRDDIEKFDYQKEYLSLKEYVKGKAAK
jgi:hypothetical protein